MPAKGRNAIFCLRWVVLLMLSTGAVARADDAVPASGPQTSPPSSAQPAKPPSASIPKPYVPPPAPAAPVIQDPLFNTPIHRSDTSSDSAPGIKDTGVISSSHSGLDMARVILALGGVIALIFVMRMIARRMMPGAMIHKATHSMKVVSRCTIAPRQSLLMVQVGKRLVVVGDTGSSLNPLCEISDPEEVGDVLKQIRDESIAASTRFDSLFSRARKGFGGFGAGQRDEEPAEITDELPVIPPDEAQELEGTAMAEEAAFDPTHEIHEPSIDATRLELSGLSEKVKDLARQLGNT